MAINDKKDIVRTNVLLLLTEAEIFNTDKPKETF